ncbi:hypothetical protein [Microbacterium aerolatum]|uniref:hypothetical protein n=1 Tax=Microbacterium aerolatum TaxID=153731 RepID=UPI003850864A
MEVVHLAKMKQSSSLQRRIAEGKAEPISDLEREQLQQLRAIYVRRFGKELDTREDARLTA